MNEKTNLIILNIVYLKITTIKINFIENVTSYEYDLTYNLISNCRMMNLHQVISQLIVLWVSHLIYQMSLNNITRFGWTKKCFKTILIGMHCSLILKFKLQKIYNYNIYLSLYM
jgi:hypothetical protein